MSAEIPERLGWKTPDERTETIEAADAWEKRALSAEAALQAMTIDRDLWRDAHDEDCPNQAMLESTEAALSQAQEQAGRLKEALGKISVYVEQIPMSNIHAPSAAACIARAALADIPDQKEKS